MTSYYSTLLVARAGLSTVDEHLSSLGSTIGELQKSPGRLVQSVEQSSLEVWNNSNSGVNPAATTVSYYVKGKVLGFLLDDVMQLAYKRYAGERGFTPEQFRKTTEEIAGVDLTEWFRKSVSTAEELDYSEALDWFGLHFVTLDGPNGSSGLAVRDDAAADQQRHLKEWWSRDKDPRNRGAQYENHVRPDGYIDLTSGTFAPEPRRVSRHRRRLVAQPRRHSRQRALGDAPPIARAGCGLRRMGSRLPWAVGVGGRAFGGSHLLGAPFYGYDPVGNYAIHILVNNRTVLEVAAKS